MAFFTNFSGRFLTTLPVSLHCALQLIESGAQWQIEEIKMLGADYCLARAEYLRMLMLTASDPSSELRLRALVEKYRALAERAKREIGSRPSIDVAA
jgi:hypothetical protein